MNDAQFEIIELSEEEQKTSLLQFLNEVAPQQAQFVEGNFFKHGKNFSFVAVSTKKIVGAIRYCRQQIGEEQKCPLIVIKDKPLIEAKINAFAVHNAM